MRIDLFLKKSRLLKNRNLAQKFISENKVLLNGRNVKSGKTVQVGDQITISYLNGIKKVEIIEIPSGNINKEKAAAMYREIT